MLGKSNKKPIFAFVLVILAVAIMLFILVPEPLDSSEVEADPEPREYLDPAIRKLLEVPAEDVYSIEIERVVKPEVYEVTDSEIIERIITNLNSISVQDCEADSWYRDTREYILRIYSRDENGKYGQDEVVLLGEDQSGTQIIGCIPLNIETEQVVEGDLDYDYIEELYRQYDN